MKAIAALDRLTDPEHYGGKAASLAVAAAGGLNVPPGLALSWAAVDAMADGDSAVLGRLGEELEARFERPDDVVVAVRSSAVGEDSSDASFAGIHESLLGVRGAGRIAEAVVRVWRSARSPAALAYRERLGIEGTPRIAVVVQRCVDAEAAGVMFTRCPITGADERVVEGAWGLGEVVVEGLVTPDHYRLDSSGRIVARDPGDKVVARRLSPVGSTREEQLDGDVAGRLCLTDVQLLALHRLAERCDQIYGSRLHDVEWAFAGGELFLLQRRPITRAT